VIKISKTQPWCQFKKQIRFLDH